MFAGGGAADGLTELDGLPDADAEPDGLRDPETELDGLAVADAELDGLVDGRSSRAATRARSKSTLAEIAVTCT